MSFIELKNVNLGFGPTSNRTEVLRDVNLSVKENEFVAIIGFLAAEKAP
jgi:nitrate/nitrite transport system ATP-binding protein